MKHFLVWDESSRDLLIIFFIIFLMYASIHITPVTLTTVVSGEAFVGIIAFFGGKVSISTVIQTVALWQNFFNILAVLFFAGVLLMKLKINEVHHKEHKKYEPIHAEEEVAKGKMVQWRVILEHIDSESPAEWKLAILEADNMLDEILEDKGYTGETIAEKLKAMGPHKIAAYSDLWEAHKLRNQIAHGGALDMELSKKVARDTITRFGNAFTELGYL